MSILIDLFSYRIKDNSNFLYYDRWHGGTYPPFTDEERLFFLKYILNSLLIHDKLYIRLDCLEEFIDILGINETSKLIRRNELIIYHYWLKPIVLRNPYDPQKAILLRKIGHGHSDKIYKRLRQKYYKSECTFYEHVFRDLTIIDMAVYGWESSASKEAYKDWSIPSLKTHFNFDPLKTNPLDLTPQEVFNMYRLSLFESTLSWSRALKADEVILEENAKLWLILKSGKNNYEDLFSSFNKVLKAKQVPDLAILYRKKIISLNDILDIRDNINGIKFRDWMSSNDYNSKELEMILMQKADPHTIQKYLRWGISTFVGLQFPITGTILSALDNVIGVHENWTPKIFFDEILSKKIGNKLKDKKPYMQQWESYDFKRQNKYKFGNDTFVVDLEHNTVIIDTSDDTLHK